MKWEKRSISGFDKWTKQKHNLQNYELLLESSVPILTRSASSNQDALSLRFLSECGKSACL